MEKLDRPVNGGWFGEGEIVDADLLVQLLETYRFGKAYVPAGKTRSMVAPAPPPDNTTETQDEEDDNGSRGNNSVRESIQSESPNSITLETLMSKTGSDIETCSSEEIGSNNEPSSSEETGSNNEPSFNEETDSSNEIGSNEETDSSNEIGSNEETGYNWLESSSANLPSVEKETQQNAEDDEIVVEEEEEGNSQSPEEKSNLEELLATQENYELYCPSCSSCITRRVILRKTKCGKEIEPPAKTHIVDDDQEDKAESYIFTCLACLKYFIRLGARFLQLDYVRGKPAEEPVEVRLEARKSSNSTKPRPQNKPDREGFAVEVLKSTVYGGLTETITSLGVVSSASASGSSTLNILALAVANLAGGLIVLAQNLHDLRNNSDQERDRYEELLGRRANFRLHILVAVLSYILFGLIPPLVYAFSRTKNNKLVSVFSVSLVCVILLGMINVYVRKPPSCLRRSRRSYLKSVAYYTSILVASSGISYVVGDIAGEYIGKIGWFSFDQVDRYTSTFDGTNSEEYRFTSF